MRKLSIRKKIDYEVKIEHDNNMYKTEKKVKVKGSQGGEKEIFAKVVRHNGVIVDKEILEEKKF